MSEEKAPGSRNTLDSFVNFLANLGISADNAMTDSTYGFNPITRNRTLLEWIHRGSWIGGVAVDVVADDMTRAGIKILGEVAPEHIEAIEEAAVSLGIWNALNNTIKWARLYGGALAVILVDGQDFSTPLRINTIKKGQFRGLMVLDRWMVEPSLSELVSELGPYYGLPKYYKVTASGPGLASEKIHYSRCIRLEGIHLPYWQRIMENLWGLSVIERLYDRLISFDSATTGAAQLVYKAYLRTFKIKGLREVVAAGGDALAGLTAYLDTMRRFQGIEGMTIMDGEDEFEASTHNAFSGLSDALQQFGQQLSGALQIPLVRLFGQSPAGFSTGESDLRSYYDTINQQQEKDLRVGVTLVYRALAASDGIALPEGTRIKFNSLWDISEEQKANIASSVSNAINQAEGSGIIDRTTALKELKQSSQITGIFSNIGDELISQSENELPPIPESELPPSNIIPIRTRDQLELSAGILFVTSKGEFLLICRGPQQDHPREWSIPCGHLEVGETLEQGALREAEEEVGYRFNGKLNPIHFDGKVKIFEAYLGDVDPFPVRLNEESVGSLWVTKETLPSPLYPGLENLILGTKLKWQK